MYSESDLVKHYEICKIFVNYPFYTKEDLEMCIRMRTNYNTETFDQFREIYEKYRKEAGEKDLLVFMSEKYFDGDISSKNVIFETTAVNAAETKEEVVEDEGVKTKISLTGESLDKIIKKKRNKRYYKEMDMREKEVDNQIDLAVQNSYLNDKLIHREEEDELKVIDFYSPMDSDFRQLMLKIMSHGRFQKEESEMQKELDFLEEYFYKNLKIPKSNCIKNRLSTVVAEIMKHLQEKIFQSDSSSEVSILHFFKNRLYVFYNYYRK